MNKRILLMIGGAVVALVLLIVGLSFIGKESPVATPGGTGSSIDTELTSEEKAVIENSTVTFLAELGNYGWYPDLIKNPQATSAELTDEYLFSQDYSTADEAKSVLRTLSNGTELDSLINGDAFNAPFSVESNFTEAIVVPNKPIAQGNRTVVVVTAPVNSTLAFVGGSFAHVDEEGNQVPATKNVYINTYEGNLSLTFEKVSGQWSIVGIESEVGVLATDEWFVIYGAATTKSVPVTEESHSVS